MTPLQFAHPWVPAAALPLAAYLFLVARHSLTAMPNPAAAGSLSLRFLLLSCLLMALAGAQWVGTNNRVHVTFLVDASDSLGDKAPGRAADFLREATRNADTSSYSIHTFADDVVSWKSPQEPWDPSSTMPTPDGTADSRIATALALASASAPPMRAHRIVLLSDGNPTGGSLDATLASLAASGVSVDTVPLPVPATPEVLVADVQAPENLRDGAAFSLAATVLSNRKTNALARLYQDQFPVPGSERHVALQPGSNRIAFNNLQANQQASVYEVEVTADKDTEWENNLLRTVVRSTGAAQALLVDGEPGELAWLGKLLETEGFETSIRQPEGVPASLDALQRFDLVVLSDTEAGRLGDQRMNALSEWVGTFGGGLIVAGGPHAYGAGGYYRSELEKALPVRSEGEERQEQPSVALLVALDRSGSMASHTRSGETKMALANQGTLFAYEVLSERDYFGLLAVDTRVHDVVPLERVSAMHAAADRILSVQSSGGGIYVYSALREAQRALRSNPARIKHVILFSDAADAEEKSSGVAEGAEGGLTALALAARMLSENVTVSVVALGNESDRDVAFLKAVAARGSGRFYLTNDPLTLPRIFTAETMRVAQSSLVEEPVLALPSGNSPTTSGINWEDAPFLLGYNRTVAKPTASVPLQSELGDPLLAEWTYGLGRVAAFTSDAKPRWATEWLDWNGAGQLWTQLARSTMRRPYGGLHNIKAKLDDGSLSVQADFVDTVGNFRNNLAPVVRVVDEDGTTTTATAHQTAPGRYFARLPAPGSGTRQVSVDPGLPGTPPVATSARPPFPEEHRALMVSHETLRHVASTTGGRFHPKPQSVFRTAVTPATHSADLTRPLLLAAALLLLADVAVRRLAMR